MNFIKHYNKNKPLVNSILTGLFYFVFCWSLEFSEGLKGVFISLMPFLPGMTFPLTTCYYKTELKSLSDFRKVIHFIISILIYHGSVWLFSGEGQFEFITVLAGLLGSFVFLIVTKYILKMNISFIQIILSSILSGLAFLQYEVNGRVGIYLGIAVCLWTIINGHFLNIEYRKQRR